MNNKLRYDMMKKKPNKNILNKTRMKLYEQEERKLKLKNIRQIAIVVFLWISVFSVLFIIIRFINSII
jgi:hypothetical protein